MMGKRHWCPRCQNFPKEILTSWPGKCSKCRGQVVESVQVPRELMRVILSVVVDYIEGETVDLLAEISSATGIEFDNKGLVRFDDVIDYLDDVSAIYNDHQSKLM